MIGALGWPLNAREGEEPRTFGADGVPKFARQWQRVPLEAVFRERAPFDAHFLQHEDVEGYRVTADYFDGTRTLRMHCIGVDVD